MVRVKFCGIRSLSDALAATRLGVDAVGFIFVKDTPRYIKPSEAAKIISSLPPLVMRAGVFVNPEILEVEDVARECKLDVIQLHGEESSELCSKLKENYRVIKTLKVREEVTVDEVLKYKDAVNAILLDTFNERVSGGTGQSFDWKIARELRGCGLPIVLSGGLNPKNIREAIKEVNPYGVDVSSGIEKSPGVKDHELMGKFIASLWEEEWGL